MKKTILDYTLKVRIPLIVFVIIASFMTTYFVSRQERDGVGNQPVQPIKYSHKLHAGTMGIDCQYCHVGVTKGRQALVPSVNICMNCHTVARKDKPEIIKLKEYSDSSKALPWKRIHKVPEYAYFNHSVHVNVGIDCESCHGNVREMEEIKQVKAFNMSACIACHKNPEEFVPYVENIKQGPLHCAACHR